jgi:hypothetical protein
MFIFLAVIVLCLFTSCITEVLPKPAFPLEKEVIASALLKSNLPGIISESETIHGAAGNIIYVVRNPYIAVPYAESEKEAGTTPDCGLIISGISSAVIEGERYLSASFTQGNAPDKFAWSNWKRHIVFAALLYGGFENEEEIYNAFKDKEFPEGEYFFAWDAEIQGRYIIVNCQSRNYLDSFGVPKQREHVIMRVVVYESYELYQKIQDYYSKIKKNP